jgi:Na+/melibiose symporter-like transporter
MTGTADTATAAISPHAQQAAETLPWMTRITYSLGNAAETIKSYAFETFVLFYYTQVLGLSPALAGVALAIVLVADALVDPGLGAYSDSLKNARYGRRNTLMYASILPTAIFFFALFSPPGGMGQIALFIWLTVTAILMRVSISLFYVPYQALTPELSTDPGERATLAVMRSLVPPIFRFGVVPVVAFSVFFVDAPDGTKGQLSGSAYPGFALFCIALISVLIFISAVGTQKRMLQVDAMAPREGKTFSWRNVASLWVDAIGRHANFRWLFLGSVAFFIMVSTTSAYTLYLATYFYKLTSTQIQIWQGVGLIAIVTAIASRWVIMRYGAKPIFVAGLFSFLLAMIAGPLLPLIGILPASGSTVTFVVLVLLQMIAFGGQGLVLVSTNVMYAEVTDEFQYLTKSAQAGMLLGIAWFAITASQAIGKLASGFALNAIAFPTGAGAVVAPEKAADLAWIYVATAVVIGGIGVACFLRYDLSRERYRQIAAALGRPVPA